MASLRIDSTLADLRLHDFSVDVDRYGEVIFDQFDRDPTLPGVLLWQDGSLLGMMSRRRFVVAMSRAYGRELFLQRPVATLYRHMQFGAQLEPLRVSGSLQIKPAAAQAVARSADLLYEPLVVELSPGVYRLLDMHDLLIAQSAVLQITEDMLREKTRSEVMQAEKMASLGKLMAGIAHEIRNPVNFIWGNLKYLDNYCNDLIQVIQAYEAQYPEPGEDLVALRNEVDLDFVRSDFPNVISSLTTGTDRLRNLVTSLRGFSRMDESQRHGIDLHESIDGTLLILNNRLKDGIVVIKQYGTLPQVECYPGQIGQVLMNLISNAVDALLDYDGQLAQVSGLSNHYKEGLAMMPDRPWEPQITITTTRHKQLPDQVASPIAPHGQAPNRLQDWVMIRIADNGPGIPAAVQQRVFEDFFTTKPVGKGTGLGLPISHQIVQEKHQGILRLESPWIEIGNVKRGTAFEVWLPVTPQRSQSERLSSAGTEALTSDTLYAPATPTPSPCR
jgi:two-component system NtrC family sensor kinase